MPRRVQDIVPGDRRGIRESATERETRSRRSKTDPEPEVEIPIHRKKPRPEAAPRTRVRERDQDMDEDREESHSPSSMRRMPITPPEPPRPKRRPSRVKWLVIALSIIVVIGIIGFVASSFYSHASFSIKPKILNLTVNGTYVAQSTPTGSALSYEVVTVKESASSTVPATDGPQTSTKATGKITLYNAYNTSTVRLIAGTRFSNDSGLIYRLASSVIIPGGTTSSGSLIPGKIDAQIVADQPGQQYNQSKNDAGELKVVAYANSVKYDSIYAKVASDISGGLIGVKKIVNPNTVASTTANLKATITADLSSQLKGVVPDGYIMYDSNYSSSFSQPVVAGTEHNIATVAVQGVLYGIMFKKSDLIAKFSSNQSTSAFGDFAFTSPGLESLQVVITNIKDFSPDKKPALIMHAKGDLKLVGTVPIEDIKKKLEGISLADTQAVFKSYSPVIESGSGELVPPWAKIPKDPKRITVTVEGQ